MVLAEQGWPSWGLVAITLIGGTLAAGGANAINMVIDRDIDALMDRTKTRPLVTGLITPRAAMIFALALEAVAFAILWAGANLLAACLALSATLFYVFVYSLWLKRTSRQNIVIGGLGGGTKLSGLGAIYPVHSHIFVDPTPFLGLSDPARRRVQSGWSAHDAVGRADEADRSADVRIHRPFGRYDLDFGSSCQSWPDVHDFSRGFRARIHCEHR
jgi:hypothetical protein